MVSRVILQVFVNTTQALAQLKALGVQGAAAFQNLGTSANTQAAQATGAFSRMTNSAQVFANRINSVRFAFNSMAAAFGAGLGLRQLAIASDTFILINNRIGQATKSAAEHADVLQKLRVTSNETGTSIEANATAFLRFNLVMDGLGKSSDNTLKIIDTLNKAFVVNGSTTQEAQSVLLQLSQAFGAGALRGDEFRSILENATFFARALGEEMGVPVGALKELAKEGKITTEVMLGAMERLEESTNKAFGSMQRTIAMSIQEIRNEFTLWAGEAGQTTGIAANMADALSYLAKNIEAVGFALLGVIGLLTAGALGGALAGIVLAVGLIATPLGSLITFVTVLTGLIAWWALRTTDAEKASFAAAKAAREHAAALRELHEALKAVGDGTEGATEDFVRLTKAHLEASQATIDQIKKEIEVEKALIAQNLIREHGVTLAEQMLRAGEFDDTVLRQLEARRDTQIKQQEEYAKAVTRTTTQFEKTGDAAEETASKIRVMHGTSIGATALIDAHGKLIRVTRGVGEEVDKNSKKYQEQQTAIQESLDLIANHEGAVQTITKGFNQFKVLFDEFGQAIAQIDLQTGAMTELGSKWQDYQKRVEEASRTAKAGTEETNAALTEAEKAQKALIDFFDQSASAGVRSANTVAQSQTGLLTLIKDLWSSLSDLSTRQLDKLGGQVSGAISTVGGFFAKGVPLWGASIKALVGFTEATVKEMQPVFDDFAKWLLDQKFTIGIGVTYETSLGEIITNIQKRLDEAGIEIPNPFKLAGEQSEAFFAELERQALALKTLWNNIWSDDEGPEPGFGQGPSFEQTGREGSQKSLLDNVISSAQEARDRIVEVRDKFFALKQDIEEFATKSFYDRLFPEPLPDPLFPPIDDGRAPFAPLIDGFSGVVAEIQEQWEALNIRIKQVTGQDIDAFGGAGITEQKTAWEALVVGIEEAIVNIQAKWAALPEWFKEIFNPQASIDVFWELVEGAKTVIKTIQDAWTEFLEWLTKEEDEPLFPPIEDQSPTLKALSEGIESTIGTIKEKWRGLLAWFGESEEVPFPPIEEPVEPFKAIIDGATSAIETLESAWTTFFTWLKTESEAATSVGDMGPQASLDGGAGSDKFLGSGKSDRLTQEVELEPISGEDAKAAFKPLGPAATAAGAAAGKSFYERLIEAGAAPSKNILDVREFGFDTIIAEWNLALRNIKVNSQAIFAEIDELFSNIFSGGQQEQIVDSSFVDNLRQQFLELDTLVREVVTGFTQFVIQSFEQQRLAIAEAWTSTFTQLESLFTTISDLWEGWVGTTSHVIGQIQEAWTAYKTWMAGLFADTTSSFWEGWVGAASRTIEEIQEAWTEYTNWMGELFSAATIENLWSGWTDATSKTIERIKGLWQAFWNWLSSEAPDEAKISGGVGQDQLTGARGTDALTQSIEVEPIPKEEADAAFRPLIPAAEAAALAANEAFHQKLSLKLDHVEPSDNVVDVRSFGWDTIIVEWNRILDNVKTNTQTVITEIGEIFKNIFAGPAEGSEQPDAGQGAVFARGFVVAFQAADAKIREIILGTVNFINFAFNESATYIQELLLALSENIKTIFNLLQENIATLFTSIGPAIIEALSIAQETIAEAMEQLKATASEASTAAGQAIISAFQTAVNTVKSAISDLVSSIQSSMNSIVSATDTATAAMRRLEAAARAAAAAARAAAAASGSGGSALGGMITRGMALGGRVWGAGTSMSDKIWRKLSRGEYVIRSAAVAKYGQRIFDMLNHMTLPKDFLSGIGMSLGGPVTNLGPRPMLAGADGGSSRSGSTLFLELWQNGPVIETQAGPDAIETLMRHTTGKKLRSLGNLPRGRG